MSLSLGPLNVRILLTGYSGAATPETTISVVDPETDDDKRAVGAAIIFQLQNTTDTSCRTPIADADISINEIRGYDEQGVLMTTPPSFAKLKRDLI